VESSASGLSVIELAWTSVLPDGRVVEWEATGTGEPLVWVEGGPGLPAHLARADIVPVLDRFRCHLVNAPGSGRTSPPASEDGYGLAELVEFFEATRILLGIGPVTVMGHSWGGLVGPAWAALHPEGVDRLIVISGYAGAGSVDADVATAERDRALDRLRDRPWFDEVLGVFEERFAETGASEEELVEVFGTCLPFYFAEPDDPVSRAHIDRIRREQRWHVPIVDAWSGEREDADYRGLFARIRCPTLVITGEHDWICGPTWNRALAEAIPGSLLVEIPDVGHLPQYEAPAAFRAAIDAWLRR
jgi:proline iminopeptidase